jgi:hypothetical protein
MKIYLFNPETGIYLGEDFADEAPMRLSEYVLPPDATTIAPPRVERGQILVFNVAEERWDVRDSTQNRQQYWQNKTDGGLPDILLPFIEACCTSSILHWKGQHSVNWRVDHEHV